MSSTADEWKNGSDSAVPDSSTTNSYAWYDGAQLATSSFDSDTGSGSNTIFVSTYAYDGLGRVASVDIADGRRRTASFAYTPEGQVLSRKERSAASANPEDMRYFVSGAQIGELTSNGNNDPLLADYAQTVNTIRNWTPNPAGAPFRWNTTGGATRGTFGAGSGYDPINPYGAGANSAQSSYTVRGGETLQSIAANVWGDASMWYLLASANGMSGGETLAAGQSLIIPDRVTNIHNNSSTFEVYDPNRAMGDLSPTTAKPPKSNKCAVVGQVLLVAIAVAVSIWTAGVASALGPVLAGALGGAAGSVVSQGVGMAIGLQDKFSFKGVAMAALAGGVGGALGPGGAFGKAGAFGGVQSGAVQGALRGAVGGLITQGIAVATGLQKKFDWAGIVGDAIGGGISGAMNIKLSKNIGRYGGQAVTGAASAIASAGARTLLTGTSFGDNLIAALPGVIGSTIGNFLGDRATNVTQGWGSNGTGNANSATAESAATLDGGPVESEPAITVTGTRRTVSDAEILAEGIANREAGPPSEAEMASTDGNTIPGIGDVPDRIRGASPWWQVFDDLSQYNDARSWLVGHHYITNDEDQLELFASDIIDTTDSIRINRHIIPVLDRYPSDPRFTYLRDILYDHVLDRNAMADDNTYQLVRAGIAPVDDIANVWEQGQNIVDGTATPWDVGRTVLETRLRTRRMHVPSDYFARGRAFESDAIRGVFGHLGVGKNTTMDRVRLASGQWVNTIADVRHRAIGLVEFKDVRRVSNSNQLRAQAQYALDNNMPLHLVVSPNNQRISGPVVSQIRETGGGIYRYDPATDTLTTLLAARGH